MHSGTCPIQHTKGPGKCVRLYKMSEPVQSNTPRDQGNVSDCTRCQNLSNPTHQGTREMCPIVQDVGTCPIQHTKGPGKCVRLYKMSEPVQFNTPRDQGNVSDCTRCRNLSNPTHQGTREMCPIVQDVGTCPIQHTKGPGKCVRLYKMSEPVQFNTPRDQGNVSDCTRCRNLSNSTHQGTREMCQIVQDVGTCPIQHTKGPGKCVRLYKMSEPVQFNTPRDQGNVSDCTRCRNLSNSTHQGTREMCPIVQDVRTCPIQHTKGPGKCVRLYKMSEPVQFNTPRDQGNVSDCTRCQNLSNSTHQGTREMCPIVQDVRTCPIQHTKGPGKCVRLYKMSEPVQFNTPRDQGNVSDCTRCRNLSNSTHQGTREMCPIVQDVRTCPIQHTKGPGKCVRLYKMSEPVQFNTPRDQGNVSDCTRCQNLSNSTHQGTREMCPIVQDVRTCPIQHTKGSGKCV